MITTTDCLRVLQDHTTTPTRAPLLLLALAGLAADPPSGPRRLLQELAADLRLLAGLPDVQTLELTYVDIRDALLALHEPGADDGVVEAGRRAAYGALVDVMPALRGLRAACPLSLAVWRAAAQAETDGRYAREARELEARAPRRRGDPAPTLDDFLAAAGSVERHPDDPRRRSVG